MWMSDLNEALDVSFNRKLLETLSIWDTEMINEWEKEI